MEEIKLVLGWVISDRSLLISLPAEKYHRLTNQINKISNSPRVSSKQLEILLGHLNHVASIHHMICHFLGRLCHAFM